MLAKTFRTEAFAISPRVEPNYLANGMVHLYEAKPETTKIFERFGEVEISLEPRANTKAGRLGWLAVTNLTECLPRFAILQANDSVVFPHP